MVLTLINVLKLIIYFWNRSNLEHGQLGQTSVGQLPVTSKAVVVIAFLLSWGLQRQWLEWRLSKKNKKYRNTYCAKTPVEQIPNLLFAIHDMLAYFWHQGVFVSDCYWIHHIYAINQKGRMNDKAKWAASNLNQRDMALFSYQALVSIWQVIINRQRCLM